MPTLAQMKAALKFIDELKPAEVPFNASRRSMGLTLPKSESVADIVANQTSNSVPAIAGSQLKTISPLEATSEAIKNMPMSRRQVIQAPVQAAVAHAGRKVLNVIDPVKSAAVPVELSEEAAHTHAADYLPGLLNESSTKSVENLHDPEVLDILAANISLKKLAKESGLSENQLSKHISEEDLKNAFHNAANEANSMYEGTSDIWFPTDEHVEKEFEKLGYPTTAQEVHEAKVNAYESAKNAAIENAMSPFSNGTPADKLSNRVFQHHAGDMVYHTIDNAGDNHYMDEVNDLVEDRLRQ